MILSKLNNVLLDGMNGVRLQKMGVVNNSVKWCVVPGAAGAAGAGSPGSGVVEGSNSLQAPSSLVERRYVSSWANQPP